MENHRIVVAENNDISRKNICKLLNSRGYITYQALDGATTIRMSRSIFPSLVIIDTNLSGMNVYEVARIIEEDELSNVLFITNNPTNDFIDRIKNMNIFAYVTKPINSLQLFQMVEFSIMNANKINSLSKKIAKLEYTLESRKKIERAKGLLMKNYKITEDEAYNFMRKKSMDKSISIEQFAEKIIKKIHD